MTTGTPFYGDGVNQVYKRDSAYIASEFGVTLAVASSRLAVTASKTTSNERDIIVNGDFVFCTNQAPGDCGTFSLGQTIVHEMGHVIGFGHWNVIPATMNNEHAFGGELGEPTTPQIWNIHEDDFDGLETLKPGASVGVNLAVGKYYTVAETAPVAPDDVIDVIQQWTEEDGVQYSLGSASWNNGDEPLAPQMVYQGTGSATVRVEWNISSDSDCSSSDPLVGYRTPGMSANVPYVRGPYSWDFTDPSIVPGSYFLCARIDPNDSISETLETDNVIVSAKRHVKVTQ